jgi:DNA-directed RNA polymerase I subunit RPA2
MQPDVIINPHAFPSRMTIGMFVESLAGKVGALRGRAQDATPFRFSEENTAAEYFGERLVEMGYNYHGNEPMYSGILGTEFSADVYIGCVFYQRLRHMVNDKFQVRTTGPVHSLTQQPVKGRKRFGGIRFGEMERDSMIAHGTSFLLKDRLMNCSDYTQSWICRDCGSVLSPLSAISGTGGAGLVRCKSCASAADGFEQQGEVWEDGSGMRWKGGENVAVVALPHVFKYAPTRFVVMTGTLRRNWHVCLLNCRVRRDRRQYTHPLKLMSPFYPFKCSHFFSGVSSSPLSAFIISYIYVRIPLEATTCSSCSSLIFSTNSASIFSSLQCSPSTA